MQNALPGNPTVSKVSAQPTEATDAGQRQNPDLSQDDDSARARLLHDLVDFGTHSVIRNSAGEVIRLTLPSRFKSEENFRLISGIRSIQSLELIGQAGSNLPPFTLQSADYLVTMTNLTSLRFACFLSKPLPAGVLPKISKMSQLHTLNLFYSDSPAEDYLSLTNLVNLESLEIHHAAHLGDAEIQIVGSLKNLKNLVLNGTGITQSGTNVLQNLTLLTNVFLKTLKRSQ